MAKELQKERRLADETQRESDQLEKKKVCLAEEFEKERMEKEEKAFLADELEIEKIKSNLKRRRKKAV